MAVLCVPSVRIEDYAVLGKPDALDTGDGFGGHVGERSASEHQRSYDIRAPQEVPYRALSGGGDTGARGHR